MRSPRLSPALLVAVALLLVLGLSRAGEVRARAEAGLARGMPPREAALARGFVLGEDDTVDAGTAEDFRRAGLSHLLAVSGQNVTLLALLAMPVLGLLGVPLRERLAWVLALIALYVPLAGAGPTIQRAAVMGGLGLLATLGGRRASRFYALAIAAAVTLAIEPRIVADVGWQLSFVAVVGIFLLAGPLARALRARLGGGGPARRLVAEGVAVTAAATLATAPLIAFHFGTVSTTSLLANVLALPAVAPAMWLGMASAAAAQVPGAPLELLNAPAGLLLAYVAQVARWCAAPQWAELQVRLGPLGLAASYAAIALAAIGLAAAARARRLAAARRPQRCGRTSSRYPRTNATATGLGWRSALLCLGAVAAIALWPAGDGAPGSPPPVGLRIVFLDVGQGDAILLQPAGADPVLVDGGPPGDDLAAHLRRYGVERLGVAVVTHDQSDHAGGVGDLIGRLPIGRLLYARLGRGLRALARAAGISPVRVARGAALRAGRLRIEVLWPPRELLGPGDARTDPNQLALVLLARWRRLSVLLLADAEAEAVPVDPGPVDVLKVAHHGSEDAGLAALLDRTWPRLAVISVGSRNPYGHPAAATLSTLAAHGVEVMRTDRDGDVVLEARRRGIAVTAGR